MEFDLELPPLPAMPAIELQFTWAPREIADEDDETHQTAERARDTAGSTAMQ